MHEFASLVLVVDVHVLQVALACKHSCAFTCKHVLLARRRVRLAWPGGTNLLAYTPCTVQCLQACTQPLRTVKAHSVGGTRLQKYVNTSERVANGLESRQGSKSPSLVPPMPPVPGTRRAIEPSCIVSRKTCRNCFGYCKGN